MKAKQTRIELLVEIGPHAVGKVIGINPMLAAKLIAQGKAKISLNEPIEEAPIVEENPILEEILEDAQEDDLKDEPIEGKPKPKAKKK
jgi:hypothetical protein